MANSNVILLAGGKSERYGAEKTLLRINGENLVERHLRLLNKIPIGRCIIVTNEQNSDLIKRSLNVSTNYKIEFILQEGEGPANAICSAFKSVVFSEALYIVTVNDIVPEETYLLLEKVSRDADIIIPYVVLDKKFIGGYLEVDLSSMSVQSIVERPEGGCKPGQFVNIFIHRIGRNKVLSSIFNSLKLGFLYEDAINQELMKGISSKAILLDRWIGIKTKIDYENALALFETSLE